MARYYRRRFKARKVSSRRRFKRYNRKRRYRRRYKRSYRRKISKPEVKYVERVNAVTFQSYRPYSGDEPKAYVLTDPGICCGIGSRDMDNATHKIFQGVLGTQRIGDLIRPIKLRIWGNLTHMVTSSCQGPTSATFRLLVLQMKNAPWNHDNDNASYEINDYRFNSWNPVFDKTTGLMTYETIKRLFLHNYYAAYLDDQYHAEQGVSIENFQVIQQYSMMPFRNGFSRAFDVLYSKNFTIGTENGLKDNINFRIKTKVPRPMRWIANKNSSLNQYTEDAPANDNVPCINPIYICWFYLPHQCDGIYLEDDPKVFKWTISYSWQLFFVDP